MADYRELYEDLLDAFLSFDKSARNLDRIRDTFSNNRNNVSIVAPSIMGEIYNATEVLVWLCNYYDADPNGDQPWVPLKDIPKLRTNMPLTPDIRHYAKEISKGAKPDFKKEITSDELNEFLYAAREFARWIIDNARNEEVRRRAEELERLIDRL